MAMFRKGEIRNIGGNDIRSQGKCIVELFQIAA
jgi:hypothetical protein